MWINQAGLTELGLLLPMTTEAFEQVLQAFKDQDSNGNGKTDELPRVRATKLLQGRSKLF